MSITFGVDTLCRHCSGTGEVRHDRLSYPCAFCKGSGLSSGPQAPVRRTDPETSVAAAASVERIASSQRTILHVLRTRGAMTDEAIYHCIRFMHQMSPSGARTRRAELVGKGLVRDSGRREKTAANRDSIVWEAVK